MSTNSSIAIQLKDGTVKSVYCHWDGYLQYNGAILQESYNSYDQALELIEMGAISVLTPSIGTKHNFNESYGHLEVKDRPCTFYHRDRGDKWEQATATDLTTWYDCNQQEYNYLFKDDQWFLVTKLTYTLLLTPLTVLLTQPTLL